MSRQSFVPYVHTDNVTWEYYFVDQKSQMIYFIKSHAGKKIKFSTREKVPNGNKAKRFANLEFDRRSGKSTRHVRALIGEELKSWVQLKESEGHKYDTMNNIRRAAKQIEEYWGDKLPSEITRDSLAEWFHFWKINHPEIQIENAVKYMRSFAKYLHQKVVNDRPLLASVPQITDPNRKANRAKRAKKKERIFTPEEFTTIYRSAKNEVEGLVVLFSYLMATRIDETLKLSFDRTVLLDSEIPIYRWFIDQNKSEHWGEHALHKALIGPLESLRKVRMSEKTALLFPQKNDNQKALKEQQIDWNAWRERANLGWHWTPHTLRHSCLTNLFNDHRNPQAVICKQYRVSLGVAIETYVKITKESMLSIKDSIEVSL